jgi:hypothetical protein
MISIACVACLDPNISVHTPGFLRAVETARQVALGADVTVTLYDDRACAEGGAKAATQIIAAKPDIVVGHFASSAAMAAAPLYAQAGLPLILPAATRSDLTRHQGVFRVCDTDRDYVAWLCDAVKGPIHAALSDGSAHGNSVVEQVRASNGFVPRAATDTVLISGLYRPLLALAGATKAQRLILTDDADCPDLAGDLVRAGVDFTQTKVVLGALRPKPMGPVAHRIQRIQPQTGAYFWETIAALQVAARFAGPHHPHDTVLGPITFDTSGEARPHSFALQRVQPHETHVAA